MNKISDTIGWADYSWNPIEGCTAISEGCSRCYAASMAKRFNRPWGTPVFHAEKLTEPLKKKKPAFIFVCSTSDLFHDKVTKPQTEAIFGTIQSCPQHTFLCLTKRPENMARCMAEMYPSGAPENVWLGVTAETQEMYNVRWPILAGIKCAKSFISVEPMLESVLLQSMIVPDLVICGPENGRGARPFQDRWLRNLYMDCKRDNVKFWDKRDKYICRERPQNETRIENQAR